MSMITTIYKDKEKTNALYPITKTRAIFDDDNVNLEQRLNEALKLQMDLLWTNASPTSTFAPQMISLDLNDYKAIVITTNTTNIDWQVSRDQIFVINSEKKVLYGGYDKNSFRYFTISATGIVFETGYFQSSYGTSKTANDDLSTPYKIYGIK